MQYIECATQAEVDAVPADDVAVVRDGRFHASGSARVSAYGSATVYARDSARVYASGSATVDASGSATVDAYGSARVRDGLTKMTLASTLPRLLMGPIGSRQDTLGVSLPAVLDDQPVIYAGCWSGTLAEFAARVEAVYPPGAAGDAGRWGAEYRAAIAMIEAMHQIHGGA